MNPAELATVAPDARFVAVARAAGTPHVVVDGPGLDGTVLALSHWPSADPPPALAADTSAGIVDRYLDAGAQGPEVDAITNNHFDEDGLFAAWLLMERPPRGAPARAMALAAAEAGDFGTWTDPWAPRCALAAMAMAERATTPFPAVQAALAPHAADDPAAAIYRALLPHTGRLLDDPDRHRRLWEPAWQRVEDDLRLLDSGEVRIDEVPELDLAIVRSARPVRGMALHPRIDAMRVLWAGEQGHLVLTDRYETWVRYASRVLRARVDLTPVLAVLQAAEARAGTWRFEGVAAPTPRLFLAGPRGTPTRSGLGAERLVELLTPLLST